MVSQASLALLLLGLAGCAVAPTHEAAAREPMWQGSVEGWGTLREALRDGQVQARVALGDVARPGTWAVGALEGLRGEITIADGEVWVSEGSAGGAVTARGATSSESATVLFAAEVASWREVVVAQDVGTSELDAYVEGQARAAGLDVSRPFPFVVEGELHHLRIHVIAGECPTRARMLGGEPAAPPFELHADATSGRLVGIHATNSSGVVCHMGSSTHVHALLEEQGGLTGHVESVGLGEGAILKLPRS